MLYVHCNKLKTKKSQKQWHSKNDEIFFHAQTHSCFFKIHQDETKLLKNLFKIIKIFVIDKILKLILGESGEKNLKIKTNKSWCKLMDGNVSKADKIKQETRVRTVFS